MSSDSTVTVRADSGEPPAKRQKTFAYGSDFIVLRFDTTEDGSGLEDDIETIGIVNATRFNSATKGKFQQTKAIMSCDGTEIADAEISVIVFIQESESVIKVLAHWISEDDIDEATLKACLEEGVGVYQWIYLLFEVIEFWLRKELDTSVHDQLIDSLVEWLKAKKNQNSDVSYSISRAMVTAEQIPMTRFPGLKSGSRIVELLASVCLYHGRKHIYPECRPDSDCNENDMFADVIDQAHIHLLDAMDDPSKFPKDPLADDFDQHCLYHLHGDKETCYKKKRSKRT